MATANYIKQLRLMPTWPARMRREVAAMYVGPVSTAQFDDLVEKGIMPQPLIQGRTPVWLKEDIDRMSRATRDGTAGVAQSTKEDWEKQAASI